jgi:hypothetical protein
MEKKKKKKKYFIFRFILLNFRSSYARPEKCLKDERERDERKNPFFRVRASVRACDEWGCASDVHTIIFAYARPEKCLKDERERDECENPFFTCVRACVR